MKRSSKKAFSILATVLACLLVAQTAFADVRIDEVTVNREKVGKNEQISIYSNSVSIRVYAPSAERVKVGSITADSVSGETYTFEVNSYKLNPGKNNVSITASATGSTDRFNFSIYYYASAVPGASYKVDQLPASGKIEAFNRTFSLVYPRNTILVDASGNPAEKSITFSVYGNPVGAPENFTPAGQIFCISVPDVVYLSQQGQLTLPYDPGISSVSADLLSVWYSPDLYWGDGDDDINLGGLTDVRRHAVTVPFQFRGAEGYYGVFLGQKVFQEFSRNLSGIGYSHPCVMTLWAKGIVEPMTVGNKEKNYQKGYFGLVDDDDKEKAVTRLEFTTMLVKGLGLPLVNVSAGTVFSDVDAGLQAADCYAACYGGNSGQYDSSSTYYTPGVAAYVETAARNGIIAGYPDGHGGVEFRPGEKLNREQAAVILARVANLKVSDDVEKVQKSLMKIFKDGNGISSWAAPSVLAAYNAKLIAGVAVDKDLYFKASDSLTRAQAITLTYRLLKKLKKI